MGKGKQRQPEETERDDLRQDPPEREGQRQEQAPRRQAAE